MFLLWAVLVALDLRATHTSAVETLSGSLTGIMLLVLLPGAIVLAGAPARIHLLTVGAVASFALAFAAFVYSVEEADFLEQCRELPQEFVYEYQARGAPFSHLELVYLRDDGRERVFIQD